jgi:hypothetical protein
MHRTEAVPDGAESGRAARGPAKGEVRVGGQNRNAMHESPLPEKSKEEMSGDEFLWHKTLDDAKADLRETCHELLRTIAEREKIETQVLNLYRLVSALSGLVGERFEDAEVEAAVAAISQRKPKRGRRRKASEASRASTASTPPIALTG